MCGIFGCVSATSVDPALSARMGQSLRHRGPDEEGVFVKDGYLLGMQRLAIVDIANGHQPYWSEDRNIVAVFNGEIYNYTQQQQRLADEGCRFPSNSDGEVIIPLYRKYGLSFVDHIDGMFAIALLDLPQRKLVCARDRMGKKPFYYYAAQGCFYFASEIKAIFAALGRVLPYDTLAVDQYFTFGYPLPPRTLYKGVRELKAAHLLVWQDGQVSERRYWQLPFVAETDKRDSGEVVAAGELSGLLQTATVARLIGEAPVGCYLSGGIDSSVIAALLKRHAQLPVTLFSLAFPGLTFDDGPFADLVATHLASPYRRFDADRGIAELYGDALWHAERPMRFSVPLLFLLLAEKVHANGIKVILSGEGADETLAGYECFRASMPGGQAAPMYAWHPEAGGFSQSQAYLEGGDPWSKELGFMPARLSEWLLLDRYKEEFYSFDVKRTLQREKPGHELFALLELDRLRDWHVLDRQLYLEMATRLPCEILFSGDRMSMARAVEVRSPFLATAFVEFAAALPVRYKIQGGVEKYLLRKTFAGVLPDAIVLRPKKPFFGSMREWFFHEQAPAWVSDALSPREVQKRNLFNPAAVAFYREALRQKRHPPHVQFAYEAALMGILGLQMLPDVMRSRLPQAQFTS